jgi:hypothetical protein
VVQLDPLNLSTSRYQVAKPTRPSGDPGSSLRSNRVKETCCVRVRVVEDDRVAKLPDAPSREHNERRGALTQQPWCQAASRQPPFHKVVPLSRWSGRGSDPGQHLIPDHPGERASSEKVAHGFHGLVTQRAVWGVWESPSRQPLTRPAAIKASKPDKELDTRGCLGAPNQPP